MEDFTIITEDDKRHVAYRLCVLASFAGGATLGSFASPVIGTVAVGLAAGLYGIKACKIVEEPLKERLFNGAARMTPQEFSRLAAQTSRAFPGMGRSQVLDMIARERRDAISLKG
jgi:hypothetical protein